MTSIRYKPLYLQVHEILLKRIEDNIYKQGETIPSESMLAEEFGTSISTIRQAVSLLSADGLLIKKQGKGTYVSEQKTTLRLFCWLDTYDPDENAYIRQAVRDTLHVFQTCHASLAIEPIFFNAPSAPGEILQCITKGHAPDIVYIPSYWTISLASLGALVPLDGLLPAKSLKTVWNERETGGGQYQNTLYSVSWGICPVLLFANKHVLQQANIDLPNGPMTVDTFSAVCQAVDDFYQGKDTSSYALSIPDERRIDFLSLYTFLLTFHGGFMPDSATTLFDSPENAAALYWLRDFLQSHRVYYAERANIRQRFLQGDIAIISERSWFMGYLERQTGEPFEQHFEVVLNPVSQNTQSVSWSDNHTLAICSQSQHQAQAAKCIDALTNDERISHTFYATTGLFPTNKHHLTQPFYSSEFFWSCAQQLTHTTSINAQHPMFTKAMAFCAHAVKNILYQGVDIEQELRETEKYLRILYEGEDFV